VGEEEGVGEQQQQQQQQQEQLQLTGGVEEKGVEVGRSEPQQPKQQSGRLG
jgi:hypothetical protein